MLDAVNTGYTFRPLAPSWLDAIAPYNPGKSMLELQQEYGHDDLLCMASNENCLGPSARAIEAMHRAVTGVGLYPEGSCPYLRGSLSQRFSLPPETFIFGAGSHEIIDLAVRAFVLPDEEVLTADVTFIAYKLSVQGAGRKLVEVPVRDMAYDLNAMARAITPRTKLIFIANPNNPTGSIVRRGDFETFIARVPPDVVVVMDEAYAEYASDPEYPSSLAFHDGRRRLLTLRTFSKIHGLAGCRVGYGIAAPEMISALEKVRLVYNVNSIGQAAAAAALDDEDHVAQSRSVVHDGRMLLARELPALHVKTWPSHANFVLVDVGRSSSELAEKMIKKGIIIRPVGPTLVRITVGTESQNLRMLDAMRSCLRRAPARSRMQATSTSLPATAAEAASNRSHAPATAATAANAATAAPQAAAGGANRTPGTPEGSREAAEGSASVPARSTATDTNIAGGRHPTHTN